MKGRAPSVEQDKGGRLLTAYAQCAQIGQVAQGTVTPGARDGSRAQGAHAGDAQQIVLGRQVDLHGEVFGMGQCPSQFGVAIQWQVAIGVKGELLRAKAVLAQHEVGLVQPMLPQRRSGISLLKRRVGHRVEGGIVGAPQAHP